MDDVEVIDAAAPVRAWRYWQLSARGRLRSVAQRQVEWDPERPMHALCIGGGHPAPFVQCSCGISGTRDLESLRQHGLCVLPGPLVVGEVFLWGRLVHDSYGYRGEFARPASLSLVRQTVDDERQEEQVLASLRAYGVPVTTVELEDAVAGITASTLAFQNMARRASRTRAD
jgi:hypothetical protein